ncbi:MAG: PGF-CTERM sorting domain-containing protein [Methanophagales archaeon ANME-1-THS]|nr:MAG: PGF-CTERM sorting domain-containing protein [Methanophagales archaeon ANME-1-THS]
MVGGRGTGPYTLEVAVEKAGAPAEEKPPAEETPGVPGKAPGFEAVFAIAGLLALAYLILRRKK